MRPTNRSGPLKHALARQRLSLLLLLLPALSLGAHPAHWRPKAMIVFGDGDSNNGLTYVQRGIPASPPYWHRRFSNGPVAAEYLGYNLGVIPKDPALNPDYSRANFLDYAVLNASSSRDLALRSDHTTSLQTEILAYAHTLPKPRADQTLAFIFMGGESLLSPKCMGRADDCADLIATHIRQGILQLYALGIRHFFVCTPNDLENAPFTHYLLHLTPQQLAPAQEAGQRIARSYLQAARSISSLHPDAEILIFNTYQLASIEEARYQHPVSTPCYLNMRNGQEIYRAQVNPVCSTPSHYYYFDIIHPTTGVFREMSQAMYNQIQSKTRWADAPLKHWWQRWRAHDADKITSYANP